MGTGERLLGLAGFGCARRHRQRAQTNLESDWLVGSTVAFLRAVSHMTVPKLIENKTADDAQPTSHSLVPRPRPKKEKGSGDWRAFSWLCIISNFVFR